MNIIRFVVLAAIPVASTVQAQSLGREATREARDARLDARLARSSNTFSTFSLTGAKSAETKLTLGLARDADESDSKSTSTPFILSHQTAGDPRWWRFSLSGDGYSWGDSASGKRTSGLSDLKLVVAHDIGRGFTAIAGLSIPSHGDMGSHAFKQQAKLSYDADLNDKWSFYGTGSVTHLNSAVSGTSSYAQVVYLELDRTIIDKHTVLVGMSRTHRGGAGSSTELSGEYDFPIGAKFKGAASVIRGVTAGSRHTGFELDLSHSF